MAPPFAAVYFACDSTLSPPEGVDELLEFADPELRRDIAALTTQAMDGTLPLAEVYESWREGPAFARGAIAATWLVILPFPP